MGNIGNRVWINEHLGEERTMNNGMHAMIICGRTNDLTVQFEDETTVQNKKYACFIRGAIGHPTLKTLGTHILKDSYLGSFDIKRISFQNMNEQGQKQIYYECKCRECGENGILTPQEILKHECKKG